MRRNGHADLPLHGGHVPAWLAQRMQLLGTAIAEVIVQDYGNTEFVRRMSDPFWFQSLGCVMGMDWHSSGITTAVMGALKRGINERSSELGLFVCGGRGRFSRKTPDELLRIGDQTGLDGHDLARTSKLTAKIDSAVVQDGFQLYLHSFVLSDNGEWAVIQQGMNTESRKARRYHWSSNSLRSFVDDPHTAVCGEQQGTILNLAASEAGVTRQKIMDLTDEKPAFVLKETRYLKMPDHHDVRTKDVDLRRLGGVLSLAYAKNYEQFEDLVLTPGLGARTLQALTLVSEVIHGTPTRFSDPARYSFAHGGKDGHPFPVPLQVFDQTIAILNRAIQKSKLGQSEMKIAFRQLGKLSEKLENQLNPDPQLAEKWMENERRWSDSFDGRTVFNDKKKMKDNTDQLDLFES